MRDLGAAPRGAANVGAAAGAAAKRPRPYHVAGLRKADRITKVLRQRQAAGAARAGAIAKPPSDKQVQFHVDHYAENPQQHARALKQLGMTPRFIRAIQVSSVPNPKTSTPGSAMGRLQSGLGNFTGSKLVDRTLQDLSSTALYAIPGAAITAKNIGADVGHAAQGDFSFKGTRAAGSAIGKGLAQDVEHPLRRPGFTLLDAGALLSGGAGAGARGAAALRAVRAGEGIARAVTRKGFEGGSLLHAPQPGTIALRAGKATVEKPLSRNAAFRQVQKAAYRRKQVQLDTGAQGEKAASRPGRIVEGSAQRTFGNRLRVQRRMDQAHMKGDLEYVRRLGKGLSRGEHTAMRVAAIEGTNALANASEVIGRHIATHERQIAAGADKAAHQAVIRDLRLAQPILENPSSHFTAALQAARDLANHGEQESIARGLLSEKTAAARKQVIAAEYGGKAGEGSFYFHAGVPTRQKGAVGRIFSPHPGAAGLSPPQTGRYVPELKRQFTGRGIRKGLVPTNIPRVVSQSYGRRILLHSAHDLHETLQNASTATRESRYQIPIRAGSKISSDLKKYLAAVEENVHASPEELRAMTGQAAERLKQEMQAQDVLARDPPLGANIKGVRWVDQRFIKDLGNSDPSNWFAKAADAITNPVRATTLYLRPAYALNALGNASMLAPEGPLAAKAMWKAARADKLEGTRNTAWRDASMGSGRALGQAIPTGFGHRAVEGLANGWNTVTDLHARRAAHIIETERAGFKTRGQLDRLRTDPKLAGKRNEIAERARTIIGDYENLTPAEKNAVRRLIYFYPWLKVATKWTGHTVTEHPVKTAIAAQNGKVEAAHVQRILGLLPQWARLSGLLPVGKKVGGLVDTVNPSSVNTPSTVVQAGAEGANTTRALIGLKQKGTSGLQDAATPFLQSILTAGGQVSPGATQKTGLLGAVEGTPQFSALKRLGIAPSVFGPPSKTYPSKGPEAAAGPLAFGGLFPRPTSVTALNASGLKEQRAALSPEQRVRSDYHTFSNDLKMAVGKVQGATITPELHGRLMLRYERATARQKAAGGRKLDSRTALLADVGLIRQHGWIDDTTANQWKASLAKAATGDLPEVSRYLTTHYFDRDHLLSESITYLRKHGHPNLKLPALP